MAIRTVGKVGGARGGGTTVQVGKDKFGGPRTAVRPIGTDKFGGPVKPDRFGGPRYGNSFGEGRTRGGPGGGGGGGGGGG